MKIKQVDLPKVEIQILAQSIEKKPRNFEFEEEKSSMNLELSLNFDKMDLKDEDFPSYENS